jgi:hypothetical protein
LAAAAADGVVRLFATKTLGYEGTLPRPAPRGMHGVTDADEAGSEV